jgi:hypothetical protein
VEGSRERGETCLERRKYVWRWLVSQDQELRSGGASLRLEDQASASARSDSLGRRSLRLFRQTNRSGDNTQAQRVKERDDF